MDFLELLKQLKEALKDSKNKELFEKELKEEFPKQSASVNLDNVKDFLEKTDAGKLYFETVIKKAKTDAVSEFKESDDLKTLLKSENDAKVAAALAEFSKKHNIHEETPEEKAIRLAQEESLKRIKEMEDAQKELTEKLKRKELEAQAASLLTENKLSMDLLNVIPLSDEEQLKSTISTFSNVLKAELETKVKDALKAAGRKPEDGGDGAKITQQVLEDLAKKAKESGSIDDRVAYAEAKAKLAEQGND